MIETLAAVAAIITAGLLVLQAVKSFHAEWNKNETPADRQFKQDAEGFLGRLWEGISNFFGWSQPEEARC